MKAGKDPHSRESRSAHCFAGARFTAGAVLVSAALALAGLAGCGDFGSPLEALFAAFGSPPKAEPLKVTSVTPESGPAEGGTEVTIRGTGFQSDTGVLFGTLAAADVQVANEGLMRVTTPASQAGSVPVMLIDGNGQEVPTTLSFTYLEPEPAERPLPGIISVTPQSGPAEGGTEVTIQGTHFEIGTGVLFGDMAAATIDVVNEGLLRVVTPAHEAGPAALTLIGPAGDEVQTSLSFTFADSTVPEAPVSITSATPDSGPLEGGTEVTLEGSGFSTLDPVLTVLFGATPAPSANVISDTQIRTITPAHAAGTTDVVVVDESKRSATLTSGFTFIASTLSVTSINPTSGPIAGGTQVTIRGDGFVSGTIVLFDTAGADVVTVLSSNVLTATTPAHDEGLARVLVMTPDGQEAEAPQRFSYLVVDPSAMDSDGDGLTDAQEAEGWDIAVDLYGFGSTGNLSVINVTSDPYNADSDDDGLTDHEERLIGSDPRNPDTDQDGLNDFEELRRWLTSPISVDTDGDARGCSGNLPPNSALFDGAELKIDFANDPTHTPALEATSPTLADTDGDGRTDYEEYDHVSRSPVIADLPALELKIVDPVDVRLDVQYAEEQGRTTEYGTTLTESTTHTTHINNNDSLGITVGQSVTAGMGIEAKVGGVDSGGTFSSSLSTTFGWQLAYTHTWESGVEDSQTSQNEVSQLESKSLTHTETAASGSISTGVVLTNIGPVSYHLSNLGMTVRMFQRQFDPADPSTPGAFRTLATLAPALGEGFTLAPGQSSPVLQWQAEGLNADRVKDLLRQPNSLSLEQAYYELQTEDGVNYAFIEEVTRARTATVSIDFGDGEWHKFRVATNVNRGPQSTYPGVTLAKVMDLIGYEYQSAVAYDRTDPANPVPVRQILNQVRPWAVPSALRMPASTSGNPAFWTTWRPASAAASAPGQRTWSRPNRSSMGTLSAVLPPQNTVMAGP